MRIPPRRITTKAELKAHLDAIIIEIEKCVAAGTKLKLMPDPNTALDETMLKEAAVNLTFVRDRLNFSED